ncbi:MAG: N-acetyl-gamma-glutamyl-phosphate reductase [Planctomycetota bacterium]|nr:N-acetyl-gamma-glutamyl-phosphate reductase [Planctomycetota bacterium]
MEKARVSVVGATGLVGEFLLRALVGHPRVRIALMVSEHAAGRDICDLLPALRGEVTGKTVSAGPEAIAAGSDVAFLAKKGPESMELAPKLLDAGCRVIDIGGEFRFRDHALYEEWYGNRHTCRDLLAEAVYGMPELARDRIAKARLVGNPGCYATAATLALYPLLKAGAVSSEWICADCYSGLTGAGRQYNAKNSNLFVDVEANLRAYNVGTHRHTPEIESALAEATGRRVRVTFVPHLAPMDRGILATIYCRPVRTGAEPGGALRILKEAYANEPFVRVLDDPSQVATGNVRGTNYLDVSAKLIERTGVLVVASALDNMVKGAAGQAVQNMNLMLGFEETAGLKGRSI